MKGTRFYLRESNKKGKTLIIASMFLGNGKQLKISSKISIEPRYWNANKQMVIQGYANQYEINRSLLDFAHTIEKAFFDIESELGKGRATPELIKDRIYKEQNPEKEELLCLMEYYKEFVKKKSTEIEWSSLQSYISTQHHLEDYEKKLKRALYIDDISKEFYQKFLSYLHQELKLNPNTAGKNIKNFKTFLKFLAEKELVKENVISNFKVMKVPSDKISLTEKELEKIHNLDLSELPRLSKTRDLFLIQCYTSMRVSDVMNLKMASFSKEKNEIRYVQEKTGELIEIAVSESLKSILDKYPDFRFPIMSAQKFNEYIKEVAQLAGLNEEIPVITYQGSKRVVRMKPKYDLITSHTGRRTFCTLSLEKGMRPEVVMKFTGHKSIQTFWSYIKIPPVQYKKELLKAWNKTNSEGEHNGN